MAGIAKDDGFVPENDSGRFNAMAARIELRTKSGADCTSWFPEVVETLAAIPGGPHVLDAEACVLDDHGRSDFSRLRARAGRRRWWVTLCVFDLLVDNGRNTMGLPLVERKARLKDSSRAAGRRCIL